MVDGRLRRQLTDGCARLALPCVSILDPVIAVLANHYGVETEGRPGAQHEMDAEYFERIAAMDFALAHDDGAGLDSIDKADVILLGVSRTSKTPTTIYLANRGIKAANYPLVPGVPLPREIESARAPLIVGLTKDPARLVDIRRNRLRLLGGDQEAEYVDLDAVRKEVAEARRLYSRFGWPVVDVTRRSIEETAAAIITRLAEHRTAQRAPAPPAGRVPPGAAAPTPGGVAE
jgi:regulator of PEP synthase PpsR (kinase-PPPase family)